MLAYQQRLAVIIKGYVYVCLDMSVFLERGKQPGLPCLAKRNSALTGRHTRSTEIWMFRWNEPLPVSQKHVYPRTQVIKHTCMYV